MLGALEIVVIEFVALSVICGILLKYYRSSSVPVDVVVSVYASWVLGFATVLILPYDLSQAIVAETENASLSIIWKTIYWSTFLLAWVILPIQMEFHSSGHFTFRDKFIDSLKKLVVAGLVALFCGFAYFIYMVSMSHLSFTEVVAFTMAMSNTYGILLIAVLMGSGLAGVPKRLWAISNADLELKRLYIMATAIEDNFQDSRFELEDCEVEINAIISDLEKQHDRIPTADNVVAYLAILKQQMNDFNFRDRSSSRLYTRSSTAIKRGDMSSIQQSDIVKLHARLIKCQEKADANQRRWEALISDIRKMQKRPNSDGNEAEDNASILSKLLLYICGKRDILSYLYKAFSLCAAGFSFVILWCELLMASNYPSPLEWIIAGFSFQPIFIQGIAFVAISYMSLCTYWTLFRLNIGWSYRLQGPQLSPFSSLIFNAEYLSRLQFALGYNFLLCLNMDRSGSTAFSGLMENIDIVPVFGTSFTVYVPLLMIVIAITTFFDGFARFLNFIGIESEESIIIDKWCGNNTIELDSVLSEKYNHGKMLVDHEFNMAKLRSTEGTLQKDSKRVGIFSSVRNNLSLPFLQSTTANHYTKLEKPNSFNTTEDEESDSSPPSWQQLKSSASSIPRINASHEKRTESVDSLSRSVRNPIIIAPTAKKDNSEPKREYSYFNIDDESDESDANAFRGRYAI